MSVFWQTGNMSGVRYFDGPADAAKFADQLLTNFPTATIVREN
jgi:hypothetical protein